MTTRGAAAAAVVVAGALTAIAYAGSDHPPPLGFLWLVLLLAGWSAAVAWAVLGTKGDGRLRTLSIVGGVGALAAGAAALALVVGRVVFTSGVTVAPEALLLPVVAAALGLPSAWIQLLLSRWFSGRGTASR